MTNADDPQRTADRAADDFIEFCRTAKREVITLSPEAYDAFVKLLEAPPQPNARLRALMCQPKSLDEERRNAAGLLHGSRAMQSARFQRS